MTTFYLPRDKTPPLDGNPFLAKIKGYPFIVVCVWNPVSMQWVYARHSIDLYDGEWNDCYFENEYENLNSIEAWAEMLKWEN